MAKKNGVKYIPDLTLKFKKRLPFRNDSHVPVLDDIKITNFIAILYVIIIIIVSLF